MKEGTNMQNNTYVVRHTEEKHDTNQPVAKNVRIGSSIFNLYYGHQIALLGKTYHFIYASYVKPDEDLSSDRYQIAHDHQYIICQNITTNKLEYYVILNPYSVKSLKDLPIDYSAVTAALKKALNTPIPSSADLKDNYDSHYFPVKCNIHLPSLGFKNEKFNLYQITELCIGNKRAQFFGAYPLDDEVYRCESSPHYFLRMNDDFDSGCHTSETIYVNSFDGGCIPLDLIVSETKDLEEIDEVLDVPPQNM